MVVGDEPRLPARARTVGLATLVLIGGISTLATYTVASRSGQHALNADNLAFRPGHISDTMTVETRGRPASPVLWKRINDGPLRPFQFDSDTLGAQHDGSNHENP